MQERLWRRERLRVGSVDLAERAATVALIVHGFRPPREISTRTSSATTMPTTIPLRLPTRKSRIVAPLCLAVDRVVSQRVHGRLGSLGPLEQPLERLLPRLDLHLNDGLALDTGTVQNRE